MSLSVPTGVYVHVPFCRKRCPYCAFVLIESDGSLHERFVDKVCREVRAAAPRARTLYFGGGTPSLLGPEPIRRLIEAVGGAPEEITVECNPEGLRLEGLREAGATRITLGIQALDDALLRFLGREHDAEGARRAYREASRKFDNICVDLIFGVPGQTLEGWRRTLAEVRSWRPAHVSLYGLTYEKGTPFEKIYDLVFYDFAIHWFDFERFYTEVNRVLASDGVIAVWAYGIDEVEGDAVNAIAQDYYSNVVGPYWPPERVLVEQGYRTIPFPFTEISAPPIQMEMQWDLDALLGFCSTWSATNRFIKAKGFNPLERLNSQFSEVWGERERTRRVTWPLSMRIGRKG